MVAISGDRLVIVVVAVGISCNDGNGSDFGHVRVYQYADNVSAQLGGDIDGEAASNYSGHQVVLSDDGTAIAIGLYGNDANGSESGYFWVYAWSN